MQTKPRNHSKRQYWDEQFARFRQSGLSQKKYCENEGISFSNFKRWFYKISSTEPESNFVRVIPSTICGVTENAKIRIQLSDKITIELDENISEETLRKIFKASEVLHD